jgi:(p)ppGpp synthase/HD superfamily hydrolase
MDSPGALLSLDVERALRWAATSHHGQFRKASAVPYLEHLAGVALILARLGFDDETVIAGLLHDLVEDTGATAQEVEARFGAGVAETVQHCSEVKLDAAGRKRPWIDRKRDHLAALADAPIAARAVVLADKLHNLLSIELDLREGRAVWPNFNAERALVLDYYRTTLAQLGTDDPRLVHLAEQCRQILATIEALEAGKTGEDFRLNG